MAAWRDEWKGKWALVTGASAGIGAAIAAELAASGTNLVLTARRKDRLKDLAGRLSSSHQIRTEICTADLTDPRAPKEIFHFTKTLGIEIELLVNNAGFGQYGEFSTIEPARLLEMVQVNCSAVVHLTRLYCAEMVARRHGDILIVASTAAFQSVPYITTYAATKSFDLLIAEGLAEEMKPHGVRVCALCPGSTTSEFHEVASHPARLRNQPQESAEKVVRVGLAALAAGRSYVVSGARNYLGVHAQRLVPRRFISRIVAKMFRPAR